MDMIESANQQKLIYILSVQTLFVVHWICKEQWMIWKDGEKV